MNTPQHYQHGIEPIVAIEDWRLGFNLGNVIKYVARAGKKTEDPREDLQKALWYLQRELNTLNANARKETT